MGVSEKTVKSVLQNSATITGLTRSISESEINKSSGDGEGA